MKALVGTFNKEKALVGAFLVNVNFSRSFVYPSFQALVRSCHHDNHAILTGGSGSGDVSPLPFHLLVNSFSSHIIHSIQILNVSTGPIFLPMVLNAHWKVSKNEGLKEIEVKDLIIIQCYWWVTAAGVSCPGSDVCNVHFSVPNVGTRGWRALGTCQAS